MSAYKVDTSDPGKAAAVFWAGAVLFARVSGMNAENDARKSRGEAMAYTDDAYRQEVWDAHAELEAKP